VRKFQHNAFAIKTQEGGLPDFFQSRVTRMTRTPSSTGEGNDHVTRDPDGCLAVPFPSGARTGLTAAQRNACMGDYEKYCKDVTPGGGRIIACLAKSSDKLTPACKKVPADAEKK
jgi:hypothetical protein